MDYSNLANLLQSLEKGWRNNSTTPNPAGFPSHIRVRNNHSMQYFALSNRTFGQDAPVVVLVGANYTQNEQTIPDEAPVSQRALNLQPHVEDQVNDYERAYIKACNSHRELWVCSELCSPSLENPLLAKDDGNISPYHLVMTNLTPWITTDSWNTIADADGRNITADLLCAPPSAPKGGHRYPFEHIWELKERLNKEEAPVVWIGHGKDSVWEHFRILMTQMQVENWMLTANLGYPMANNFLDRPTRFTRDYRRFLRLEKDDTLDLEE